MRLPQMSRRKVEVPNDLVISSVRDTNSLAEAAKLAGVSYQTFARRAAGLGIQGNPALKGVSKPWTDARKNRLLLEELLTNKKSAASSTVKAKLFAAGLKKNECEECGISEWQGKRIACHLDHTNGNNKDNRLENLKILCPNCHSQTPTYCRGQGKNK